MNIFFIAFIVLALRLITFGAAVHVELLSKTHTNAPVVFGDTMAVELSGDGKWALLTSSADALPREDQSRPSLDVFLRNVATGESRLISHAPGGPGGNGLSIGTAISGDGRFAIIESEASDLVPGDTNNAPDIFLYDSQEDRLRWVSQRGDAGSRGAVMSPDGRFVLFQSAASNLAPNDTNGVPDYFLYDRQSETARIVAAGALGGLPRPEFDAEVSPDGRYVAFLSTATNLNRFFGPPPGSDPQLFVADMSSGEINWITVQSRLGGAPYVSNVRLGTNGVVGFISSDLAVGPASLQPSTYIYTYSIDPIVYLKIPDPAGIGTYPRRVREMEMSDDARFVAYTLEWGSAPFFNYGLYLFDRMANTNHLISTNQTAAKISLSGDGRILTFLSPIVDHGPLELMRFDRLSGLTEVISREVDLSAFERDVFDPVLSADGGVAAFTSLARENYEAYFVATSGQAGAAALSLSVSSATSGSGAGSSTVPESDRWGDTGPHSLTTAISKDGSRIVFTSSAWNLVPNDTNPGRDLFVLTQGEGIRRLALPDGAGAGAVQVSDDGSVVLTYNFQYPPLPYVLDVNSGRDLLEGIDRTNMVQATLSADGRFLAFTRRAEPGENPTANVLELMSKTITVLPYRFPFLTYGFSASGRFVLMQKNNPASCVVLDWRSGQERLAAGSYVASTPEDVLLFTTAPGLGGRGSLYFFTPGNGNSASNFVGANVTWPALSQDGSTLAFNENGSAVILDRASGSKTQFPARADGKASYFAEMPALTPDGRFLAFTMRRDNGAKDADYLDVYFYNRALNSVTLVSQTASGTLADLPSRRPSITADGRRIVFESLASDLVPEDRNLDFDVFLATVDTGELRLELRRGGINWPAESGKTYNLQFRRSLSSGDWETIRAGIIGFNGLASQPFAPAPGTGFYRVEINN